jgi:hypothetical protein
VPGLLIELDKTIQYATDTKASTQPTLTVNVGKTVSGETQFKTPEQVGKPKAPADQSAPPTARTAAPGQPEAAEAAAPEPAKPAVPAPSAGLKPAATDQACAKAVAGYG